MTTYVPVTCGARGLGSDGKLYECAEKKNHLFEEHRSAYVDHIAYVWTSGERLQEYCELGYRCDDAMLDKQDIEEGVPLFARTCARRAGHIGPHTDLTPRFGLDEGVESIAAYQWEQERRVCGASGSSGAVCMKEAGHVGDHEDYVIGQQWQRIEVVIKQRTKA